MTLATKQDLLDAFCDINNEVSGVDLLEISDHATLRTGLYHGLDHRYHWTFRYTRVLGFEERFQSNLCHTMQNQKKYTRITGKTQNDTMVDFLFHWRNKFMDLQTPKKIQERIADPATCGAIATVIAVNRLAVKEQYTDKEVKTLLKGSHWRWVRLQNGDWVPKTLYGEVTYTGTTNFVESNETVFDLVDGKRTLATIRNLVDFLEDMVETCLPPEPTEELRNYDAKATDIFPFKYGKNKKYTTALGIELELENHSQIEFKSLNTLKTHAIFKRDGSVRTGVEICTAPATLDIHLEAFKTFFDALIRNNSDLVAKENCGLHVHIDRKKLSTLHIANLCLLLNNKTNEKEITQIAGRRANNYCERTEHSYLDFTTHNNQSNRYRRVNLTNQGTVEIRMFAATTDYEKFKIRLEFTQAVVDYTRPGETNLSVKLIPIWENFKIYVKQKANFYPELFQNLFPEIARKIPQHVQI